MTNPAQQERDALLPRRKSRLAVSDPELTVFFEDFAFDETVNAPAAASLSRQDRLLYQLGAMVALGALTEFRGMLGAALDNGVSPIQAKEALYQAVAYVGIARVLDFLLVANDILTARGISLPLESQSTTSPETRLARGTAKQKEIVGEATVEGLYRDATPDTLHFQEFLSANCFGDYYTRTGLDLKQRELLTFTMLVALGGAESQVSAHVTANLHIGNTRVDLLAVLTVLVPYIGYPRTLNGLAAVNSKAPAEA